MLAKLLAHVVRREYSWTKKERKKDEQIRLRQLLDLNCRLLTAGRVD